MKFLMALMTSTLLATQAFAQDREFEGVVLNVNSFGGALDEAIDEVVIKPLYEKYGIEVVRTPGPSMQAVSRAIASGNAVPYDVLMTDSLSLPMALEAGLYDTMTEDEVPNLADIYDNLLVEGQGRTAPILISSMVIVYRTDEVDTPPQSLADFARPEFAGRVGIHNLENTGGVIDLVALANANGGGVDDIDPGFEALEEMLPNIVATPAGSPALAQLVESGEVTVASVWNGRAIDLVQRGVPVEVVIPEEGQFGLVTQIGVAAGTKVREAALKYIDAMISPEAGEAVARKLFYASGNRKMELPDDVARLVYPYGDDAVSNLNVPDWQAISNARSGWMERWNRSFVQ